MTPGPRPPGRGRRPGPAAATSRRPDRGCGHSRWRSRPAARRKSRPACPMSRVRWPPHARCRRRRPPPLRRSLPPPLAPPAPRRRPRPLVGRNSARSPRSRRSRSIRPRARPRPRWGCRSRKYRPWTAPSRLPARTRPGRDPSGWLLLACPLYSTARPADRESRRHEPDRPRRPAGPGQARRHHLARRGRSRPSAGSRAARAWATPAPSIRWPPASSSCASATPRA